MKTNRKILLSTLLFAGWIHGQEKAPEEVDPFSDEATVEARVAISWDVTCEIFSIPLVEAAKLKRAGLEDAAYYAELVKQVDSGKARQEEFLTVRTTAGSTSTSEEISEVIYATEYEPPEFPNEIGELPDDIEKAKLLVTPAMPSAFDTKNVGSTMEVALEQGGKDEVQVAINFAIVRHLGRVTWGQEEGKAEMPKFTTQKIKTNLSMSSDSPAMIGTVSPPAVMQKEEGGKRVWLAFLTASESKE